MIHSGRTVIISDVSRPSRDIPAELGPRLRDVREAKGESLRTVEKRCGLNNGYLSQLERGKIGYPTPTVLRRLAEGYEVAFSVVLQWAGYTEDDEHLELTPNQIAALSIIGNPSIEEVKVLREIVQLLRAKGFTCGNE